MPRIAAVIACLLAYLGPLVRGQSVGMNITIVQPLPGALSSDGLNIVVKVASNFELERVTASVDARQTSLTFKTSAYWSRGQPMPGWTGTLSLVGLPRGVQGLTVRAMDVLGNSGEVQTSFVYDRPPTLSVLAPLQGTVARPELRVTASCSDDDPNGCLLTAGIELSLGQTVELASGRNLLEQTVWLGDYDGRELSLRFQAVDSAGQKTSLTIPVYVEASNRLVEIESASGNLWDAQPDRLLYLESHSDRGVLKVRDRTSGRENVVMDQAGRFPRYGYLTPKGAIFVEQAGDVLTASVVDSREGILLELGFLNSAQSLVASGNYALWNIAGKLILRDLAAGTNTTISSVSGNWNNDVALSGEAVYWTSGNSYNIFRYHAGATTLLTSDTTLWNVYPLTDGRGVVYRKQDPCCGQQRFGLFLHNGASEIELAPLSLRPEPSPGSDYRMSQGWVASYRL